MDELSDESLVEAVLEGDDEAFIRLVTRHKRRVIGLAARFIGIREELDDICQDVFVKAYYRLRSYKKTAPFEHWLSRIAVNTCYDVLRKKKLVRAHTAPMYELAYEIADQSFDERQAAEEAYQTLSRGLAKLKAPERLVITLLELEEKSVLEVASLTGWSTSNVKVRAFRARRALRKILEDNNHE
jgi:RNA polymerase sigma-70 factor, ECF subfamily